MSTQPVKAWDNISATAQINTDLAAAQPWLNREVKPVTKEDQAGARSVRDPLASGPAVRAAKTHKSWGNCNPATDLNDREMVEALGKAAQAVKDLNSKYGIGGSSYATYAVAATAGAAGVALVAKAGAMGGAAAQAATSATGAAYNATVALLPAVKVNTTSLLAPAAGALSSAALLKVAGVGVGVAAVGYAAYKGAQLLAQPKVKQD